MLQMTAPATAPDVLALAPAASADPIACAIAGTVQAGLERRVHPAALLRGLDAVEFDRVAAACFPPVTLARLAPFCGQQLPDRYDEFDEVCTLLLGHARDGSDTLRWLAHAFATASMYENHLWQDLHLPARTVLSELFATCFPGLSARNTGNMKWKKFLYKQLCDAAEVQVCKAPSCGVCSDYANCFGAEDAGEVVEAGLIVPIVPLARC